MNTAVRMVNGNVFPFRGVSVLNLGFIPHYFHLICNIFIQHRVAIIKLGYSTYYIVRSLMYRFRNNYKIIDFVFIHFIESFWAENFQVLLS